MEYIPLLPWLYDIVLDEQGIRFVWFGFLTTSRLPFENIEYVKEFSRFGLEPFSILETWNAQNCKNRLFARCFLIKKRYVWFSFSYKILVTPKSPEDFIAWLKKHEILFIGRANS